MEKVLEVNATMLALFGVSIFGLFQWFLRRLSKLIEKEKRDRLISEEAIMAILHNKIYKNGMCYLERQYVTVEELNDLNKLYRPYEELGGNGTAKTIMENVRRLDIRKSEIQILKDKGEIY